MANPIQQGLKRLSVALIALPTSRAAMANPIQQGLKLATPKPLILEECAAMANPIQQGLKRAIAIDPSAV